MMFEVGRLMVVIIQVDCGMIVDDVKLEMDQFLMVYVAIECLCDIE